MKSITRAQNFVLISTLTNWFVGVIFLDSKIRPGSLRGPPIRIVPILIRVRQSMRATFEKVRGLTAVT
jgi:hypothetical protein